MIRIFLVLAFVFAAVAPAASQTQVRERTVGRASAPAGQQPAARNRVVGPTVESNHASSDNSKPSSPVASVAATKSDPKPTWGDSAVTVTTRLLVPVSTVSRTSTVSPDSQGKNSVQPRLIKPTSMVVETSRPTENVRTAAPVKTDVTSIYRVGVGDVLDIRIANMTTRESTLFTVLKDGIVEYPLLPRTLVVSGLTTDEIARRLSGEIKVIQNVRASVLVRDYASHAVVVSGLVDNPGRKVLRREAMPLFSILAQALPRSEATIATIVRNGRETNLSLSNNQEMATLVMSGDVIRVSALAKRFVYLGGDVVSVGEREFRDGMTLTQALLTAGGPRDARSAIKVSRRNANGFLMTEEYRLKPIADGQAPDPLLQAGDRIEVRRGVW